MQSFIDSFSDLFPKLPEIDLSSSVVKPEQVQNHIDMALFDYMMKYYIVIFFIAAIVYMIIQLTSVTSRNRV